MATEYAERIGARIRERREELGLSRAYVARGMPGKTNENQVYRWENGLHRPHDDALDALAEVLQVPSSAYFLVGDSNGAATPDPFAGASDDQPELREITRKLDLILDHLGISEEGEVVDGLLTDIEDDPALGQGETEPEGSSDEETKPPAKRRLPPAESQ